MTVPPLHDPRLLAGLRLLRERDSEIGFEFIFPIGIQMDAQIVIAYCLLGRSFGKVLPVR